MPGFAGARGAGAARPGAARRPGACAYSDYYQLERVSSFADAFPLHSVVSVPNRGGCELPLRGIHQEIPASICNRWDDVQVQSIPFELWSVLVSFF
jgi:hypothetical protein